MIKNYQDMYANVVNVKTKWDRILELHRYITILNIQIEDGAGDKEKEYKQAIEKHRKEIKKLNDELLQYNDSDFFSKRFELIKSILTRNNCTEPQFLDPTFWEECVDINEINEFLNICINKDFEANSKKQVAVER